MNDHLIQWGAPCERKCKYQAQDFVHSVSKEDAEVDSRGQCLPWWIWFWLDFPAVHVDLQREYTSFAEIAKEYEDVMPLFCIQHFSSTPGLRFQVVTVTAHLLAVCGRSGLIYRTEIIPIVPYTPEFQPGRVRREMKSTQSTVASKYWLSNCRTVVKMWCKFGDVELLNDVGISSGTITIPPQAHFLCH